MFTGIVETIGILKKISPMGKGFLLEIQSGKILKKVKPGDSICTQGVCLTLRKKQNKLLQFEVMPETLRKTVLGSKKTNDKLNLETSLKIGQELGGHFVYGHVDTVGKVKAIKPEGKNLLVSILISKEWQKYITHEGSVTLDGTSLTVANFKKNIFTVSLIDYTLKNTTLGSLKVGDGINVEFDILAKYVEKILRKR